jgi:hypothetical protein
MASAGSAPAKDRRWSAFQRAAAQGVRAHHWEFGNMPKIESVTPADVDQITQYVRWLQKQAGVY